MRGSWAFDAIVVGGVEDNGRAREAVRGDL